jgi:co-chaperonin GroES (HSP10)
MSDLYLPPSMTAWQKSVPGLLDEVITIQNRAEPAPEESAEDKARNVPEPTGWKILCIVPPVSKKIEGTTLELEKAAETLRVEEQTSTVLYVLKVGPLAYKDEQKFPDGLPWCKEGDFILVRSYTGTRFKVFGREFRLLNDDQVDAVVQDPRGITRA